MRARSFLTAQVVGNPMSRKRNPRKPDFFSVLLLVVAVGMTMTIAYQVNVFYGGDRIPIAGQGAAARVGG